MNYKSKKGGCFNVKGSAKILNNKLFFISFSLQAGPNGCLLFLFAFNRGRNSLVDRACCRLFAVLQDSLFNSECLSILTVQVN